MSQRTYSEEEVAEIIRRAAELESGSPGANRTAKDLPGLSLEELSEVAAEAGLDPENIRRAARMMDSPAEKSVSEIIKDEVYAEQWVKSSLTDELTGLIIADLNHRYNTTHEKESLRDNILGYGTTDTTRRSTIQRTGKSLEWKYLDEYDTVEVRALIQPIKDQVRIRVSKKNVWGTNMSDMDGDAVEYISYIPWLAAFAVLFSLPYSFLLNVIVAIAVFAGLRLTLVPGAKQFSEWLNRSESGTKEKRSETYKKEVERVATELGGLIEDPKREPETSERIVLPDDKDQESGTKEQDKRFRSQQGTNQKS